MKDELLLRAQEMKAIKRPTTRNYQSLFNYVWQERALAYDEAQTFFYKDDFVSLAGSQESTLLDGMIEDVLNLIPGTAAQVPSPIDHACNRADPISPRNFLPAPKRE